VWAKLEQVFDHPEVATAATTVKSMETILARGDALMKFVGDPDMFINSERISFNYGFSACNVARLLFAARHLQTVTAVGAKAHAEKVSLYDDVGRQWFYQFSRNVANGDLLLYGLCTIC